MSDKELMGTGEIAALLGVAGNAVLVLAQHDDFPALEALLKMGKVWRGNEVRQWAEIRKTAPPEP